jgi:hypothetical protein
LRKLATAILVGLGLVAGGGIQPVQAANFCFINAAPYIIYVRMFSQSRNVSWGSWQLNSRFPQCVPLSCLFGESICYGGYDDQGTQWGVGWNNNLGCSNCCIQCGTTFTWTLYK